jgi:hypothetical protein
MGYKIRINDFISQVRADSRSTEKSGDLPIKPAAPAAPAKPTPAPQEMKPDTKPEDKPTTAEVTPDEPVAPTAPAAENNPAPPEPSAKDDFDLQLPSK